MNSRDLIRQLRTVAREVKKAAHWKGSGLAVDSKEEPYVYELLCYLTLCKEVAPHFKLTLVTRPHPVTHERIATWPRRPGNKKNFSYFTLHDGTSGAEFELCPGINVTDRYGHKRAPDINLLYPSAAQPTYKELCGIWDAKYRVNTAHRISGPELSDFTSTFDVLNSPVLPAVWSGVVSAPFQRSGLLTNGQHSTEPIALLVDRRVQETAQYPDHPQTRPTGVMLPVARPAA